MEIPEIKSNQKQDIEKDKILQPIAKNPGRLNDDTKRSVAGELFKSDMKDIAKHVFWDVFVKAFKDVLIEVGHSTVDAIFGEPRTYRRSGSIGSGVKASYVPYNSINDSRRYREDIREPRDGSSIYADPIVRGQYDANGRYISAKAVAEDIMLTAKEMLDKYTFLQIGELYELCSISTRPEHFRYGWNDIRNYNIRTISRDEAIIEMPKIIPYR